MPTNQSSPAPTRKQEFWNGFKATFPLVVGATPFGMIFGALAATSGISTAGTVAMSALVFAGSSQFIAVGLVASGTGVFIIIMTTLVVNLRHALYAATLAPHTKDLSHKWLLPLGFWLTDETFVVTIQRYHEADKSSHKHWYFFGSAIFMYTNWQVWTWVGLLAGQQIDDPAKWGLDFAMTVTFIGMLVPLIKNKSTMFAVFIAAITAFISDPLPNKLGLIVAAFAGILAGVIAEQIWPEPQALETANE